MYHFAVHLKLTQHYKSTIPQFKRKEMIELRVYYCCPSS